MDNMLVAAEKRYIEAELERRAAAIVYAKLLFKDYRRRLHDYITLSSGDQVFFAESSFRNEEYKIVFDEEMGLINAVNEFRSYSDGIKCFKYRIRLVSKKWSKTLYYGLPESFGSLQLSKKAS